MAHYKGKTPESISEGYLWNYKKEWGKKVIPELTGIINASFIGNQTNAVKILIKYFWNTI